MVRLAITLALLALIGATLVFGQPLTPWVYMWSISIMMYAFFKWITLVYHKESKIDTYGSI